MAGEFRATTADQDEIVRSMPASAQRLVTIIGLLPALELLRKFGGDRVFIPRFMPGADHPLTIALGADVLSKLVEGLGPKQLEVPMLASVERCLRNRSMHCDRDSGLSVNALHKRYGLSQRRIRIILSREPQGDRSTAVTVGR